MSLHLTWHRGPAVLQGPPAPGNTADLEAPTQPDMEMGPRFSLTSEHEAEQDGVDSPPVVGKSKVRRESGCYPTAGDADGSGRQEQGAQRVTMQS